MENAVIPVDNWICGNCLLNRECKRKTGAVACNLIHQNYEDMGYRYCVLSFITDNFVRLKLTIE